MEQYVIKGGNPLVGEVEIGGAKNAALAILAAAIMTDETVCVENLPDVRDIHVLLEAIEQIGARVEKISPSAVSYTHLDVYKRQGSCPSWAIFSAREPYARLPSFYSSCRDCSICLTD